MKYVQTDGAPKAIGPYSQGMVVDGWLFASGQIPLTLDGDLVEGEIEAQAEQVFANVRAVLAAAGSSLKRVVKVTVYLQDLADFGRLNQVYERHFGTHKPARSTVQVARLPRDVKVEIEVIARVE